MTTSQRTGQPPLWEDWSTQRPVSFPTVFPSRLDVARLEWAKVQDQDWLLAHHMLIAAAVMSRMPARIDFQDLLAGRHFPDDSLAPTDTRDSLALRPHRNWLDTALMTIAAYLAQSQGQDTTPIRAAAARLTGAAATMTDWRVDETTRINTARVASEVLGSDPIPLLQLAATQIGCFRDDDGLSTLAVANEVIRARPHDNAIDQVAFLHAEAATGEKVPLTTGRLAAGMCIAFAGIHPSHAKFEAEDFFEELMDSSLLLGREADTALLRRVTAGLVPRHHTQSGQQLAGGKHRARKHSDQRNGCRSLDDCPKPAKRASRKKAA